MSKNLCNWLKAGDNAISSEQYDNAIAKYKEALKIKDDKNVAAKITDAENKLKRIRRAKRINEEFNNAYKKGDQLLASNDFDASIVNIKMRKQLSLMIHCRMKRLKLSMINKS